MSDYDLKKFNQNFVDVTSLIETPFGGRYCGKIAPRFRISLYRALSFVFLSDRENITESRFSGTYTFIPNGKLFSLIPVRLNYKMIC